MLRGASQGRAGRFNALAANAPPAQAADAPQFAFLAWFGKGNIAASSGRKEDAIQAYREADKLGQSLRDANSPLQALVPLGQGLVHILEGNMEEALPHLAQAGTMSADPPLAQQAGAVWKLRAMILEGLDRDEEALLDYEKALRAGPEDVEALQARGHAHLRLQDYHQALSDFERALELQGEDVEGLLGKGRALVRLEEHEHALESFRRALALAQERSDQVRAWESLGNTYTELGRHEAALRAYRNGWRLGKDEAKAPALATRVSGVLIHQNRDREALEFLRGVPERIQGEPHVQFNLGLALYRLGETGAARKSWTRAAEGGVGGAAELVESLRERRGQAAGAWADYWFGEQAGRGRKAGGGVLLVMAVLGMAPSMVSPDVVSWLGWLNGGQDWTRAVAPLVVVVALLLLPSLSRFSVGPVTLAPQPSLAEPSGEPERMSREELLQKAQSLAQHFSVTSPAIRM